MEEAKLIAIGSFRLVLEGGPNVGNSERSTEYSDHGEELAGMYASDMLMKMGTMS
jgi:hypothetical protein